MKLETDEAKWQYWQTVCELMYEQWSKQLKLSPFDHKAMREEFSWRCDLQDAKGRVGRFSFYIDWVNTPEDIDAALIPTSYGQPYAKQLANEEKILHQESERKSKADQAYWDKWDMNPRD
jgi:hypothetical protein